MKTIRIEFPVLDAEDSDQLLELVTDVPGVVAAIVHGSALDVVVSGTECGLLVREQVVAALAAGATAA